MCREHLGAPVLTEVRVVADASPRVANAPFVPKQMKKRSEKFMAEKTSKEEKVDRSRLHLLGLLAASGASGACRTSQDAPGGVPNLAEGTIFDEPNEPAGGEGGGGD
jgi:hypothetical protein